jgi:hypothetical protein
LILCFPGTLFRYFLSNFEMVPVSPIINGATFVFKFHIGCIYFTLSFYFEIFFISFFIPFLFLEITVSINRQVIFIITGYDARFIVVVASVRFQLLIT